MNVCIATFHTHQGAGESKHFPNVVNHIIMRHLIKDEHSKVELAIHVTFMCWRDQNDEND